MSLILGKEYGGIYEGWELIVDTTLIANATTVDISNLDGDKDEIYMFTIIINNDASSADIRIMPNALSSVQDVQRTHAYGTTIYTDLYTATNPWIPIGGGYECMAHLVYYVQSGKVRRGLLRIARHTTEAIIQTIRWNDTTTKVSYFRFEASAAGAISIGSRFLVFRKRC